MPYLDTHPSIIELLFPLRTRCPLEYPLCKRFLSFFLSHCTHSRLSNRHTHTRIEPSRFRTITIGATYGQLETRTNTCLKRSVHSLFSSSYSGRDMRLRCWRLGYAVNRISRLKVPLWGGKPRGSYVTLANSVTGSLSCVSNMGPKSVLIDSNSSAKWSVTRDN
jgi:hypothetical protein